MNSSQTPGLKQIYPVYHKSQTDINDFIIVVPSLTQGSEAYISEWPCNRTDSWVHSLVNAVGSKSALLFFEHGLKFSTLSEWQQLLRCGELLATSLQRLIASRDLQAQSARITLISHGFGGFIVKKALNESMKLAKTQRLICAALKALLYISCPHLTNNNKTMWKNVTKMILAGSREIEPDLEEQSSLEILQKVCVEYEETESRLNIQKMSLYEAQATQLKLRSKYKFAQDALLVDHRVACLSPEDPSSVEVLADHFEILQLQRHKSELDKVADFIGSSMPPMTPQSVSGHLGNLSNGISYAPREFIPLNETKYPVHIGDLGATISDFVGHKSFLDEIETRLCHDRIADPFGPVLVGVTLHGPGGIGKTCITSKFINVCKEKRLFEIIICITAKDRITTVRALAEAAIELKLVDASLCVNQEVCAQETLRFLQSPPETPSKAAGQGRSQLRWLMVFDHVEDPQMIRSFIPEYSHGSVLFTTRDPDAADELLDPSMFSYAEFVEHNLKVPPLCGEDAITLLKTVSRSNDESTLIEIVEELDGIPLALRRVGEMIRKSYTAPRFLKTYSEHTNHRTLFRYRSNSNVNDRIPTIAGAWGLEQLQSGLEIMNVISLMNGQRIDERILETASNQDAAEMHHFPTNLPDYNSARDELKRLSLIEHDPDEGRITVPKIVQATVRSKMTEDIIVDAFNNLCILLYQAWPQTGEGINRVWRNNPRHTWDSCESVRCHIDKLRDHFANLKRIRRNLDVSTPKLVWLLIFSGWYDHDRGRSSTAQELFELAQEICETLDISTDIKNGIRAEIHACRGAIATEVNDSKSCIFHYEEFFKMTSDRYGESNPSDRESHVNMAIAWNECGVSRMMKDHINDNGAYDAFDRSSRYLMTDLERNSDDERILLTWGLANVNLALACWERKQFNHAIRILDDLRQKLREELDFWKRDSYVYGRIFHALGNVYQSKGDNEQALRFHTKAYERHRSQLGKDHHRTADVALRLALHASRDKDFEKSREYLQQAANVFNSKDYYRPERARLLHYESLVLKDEGKLEDAKSKQSDAEQLFNQVLKERHGYEQDSPITTWSFSRLVTFWSR